MYPMLHSAHKGCATPFKEKKSSFGGRKKAKPEKAVWIPILPITNLRIIEFLLPTARNQGGNL